MVTTNKEFHKAIRNMDVFQISCIHYKAFYTEFTFYGKLTRYEIAGFICDVDNQNNISDVLRMEKLLEEESDYVYEDYKGHPCTTIFID